MQGERDAVGERDGRKESLVGAVVERGEGPGLRDGEDEVGLYARNVSVRLEPREGGGGSRTSLPVDVSDRTTS